MMIIIIRTAVLYFAIIAAVRFMGKRQVSDLQNSELVVTMLLSDIASMAAQNTSQPLLYGVVPMTVLVASEVLLSAAMFSSVKIRRLVCGQPIVVVSNGKADKFELRRLRMSEEDLNEQLRQLEVFSLNDVKLAIVETNGKLSVMKKESGSS